MTDCSLVYAAINTYFPTLCSYAYSNVFFPSQTRNTRVNTLRADWLDLLSETESKLWRLIIPFIKSHTLTMKNTLRSHPLRRIQVSVDTFKSDFRFADSIIGILMIFWIIHKRTDTEKSRINLARYRYESASEKAGTARIDQLRFVFIDRSVEEIDSFDDIIRQAA